jgi:hypothetical protein
MNGDVVPEKKERVGRGEEGKGREGLLVAGD